MHQYLRFMLINCICCTLPIISACTPAMIVPRDVEMPYSLTQEPRVGEIMHVPTGLLVTARQMLDVAAGARVVYVGETHDNPASHRLELTVLEGMAARHPGGVALGMEMFTPAQQSALDAWTAGKLSEKDFLRQSRWYDSWGMDFDYYRPLLLFARDNRIPVIGLNAPESLAKIVGRNKPADLPPEARAQLPEMDFTDPYQRKLVEAIFSAHAHGKAELDGFLRVQTLRDETMAQNAAAYLAAPEHAEMRLVVVAGGNHIRQGFGIPRRVFRRFPNAYVLIGSREILIPPDKMDRLMNVEIPPLPLPLFDFLEFTAYEDLGKEEARLGVVLEQKGSGVRVAEVVPGTAAHMAGLKKGDQLVKFDGQDLIDNFDLVYAVKQKRVGDHGTLLLNRDETMLTIEIRFPKLSDPNIP